ncbi:MAG: metal-dependent transcriptional regulator [Candidatus Aenigmatarchaeota archaeon]
MELSKSLEDCLEAIYLEGNEDETRVNDVAEHLSIKPSSVNQSIKKLKDDGFVSHESYGKIELTTKGKEIATKIFDRHKALERFLRDVLGVDSHKASREACLMEHGLSTETQKKLTKFIENYLNSN